MKDGVLVQVQTGVSVSEPIFRFIKLTRGVMPFESK
jgi:hypothetical protein